MRKIVKLYEQIESSLDNWQLKSTKLYYRLQRLRKELKDGNTEMLREIQLEDQICSLKLEIESEASL